MLEDSTVPQLLTVGAEDAIALAAPESEPLSFGALRQQIERTVSSLNQLGIGRNDRVGLVLPNGPEMASAFVAVASGATTAPLNSSYRRSEFEFYLSDLNARALIVELGDDSPARDAAGALGITVLELDASSGPAGAFELRGIPVDRSNAHEDGMAIGDDIALVLHTSGTTSRPKIVPLTHRNITATAANIRASLQLESIDRCLNVMPLFHIHGLMAAVLASLSAGGSVYCSPGFNALRFFSWLQDANPTWFTAVPTMHQAILKRAERNREIIESVRLRFIRSSSASLPTQVMTAAEQTFGCPLVEAYAMTEAAHQMTCNPLPPGVRKPGTVGLAAGPKVAIMNEAGALLEPSNTGEVVIRGGTVTAGYENNPQANTECFTNGWFRTGDQGVIDDEGYLTITGRLKEIINRGGEKISPLEVDGVLMDHPAVQQVVTFAVPHPTLGEEVAAVIVLREGQQTTKHEIRAFAAERLADFKVPRKVVVVDEIPKGPTGKMQRIGLAEKLNLS